MSNFEALKAECSGLNAELEKAIGLSVNQYQQQYQNAVRANREVIAQEAARRYPNRDETEPDMEDAVYRVLCELHTISSEIQEQYDVWAEDVVGDIIHDMVARAEAILHQT